MRQGHPWKRWDSRSADPGASVHSCGAASSSGGIGDGSSGGASARSVSSLPRALRCARPRQQIRRVATKGVGSHLQSPKQTTKPFKNVC